MSASSEGPPASQPEKVSPRHGRSVAEGCKERGWQNRGRSTSPSPADESQASPGPRRSLSNSKLRAPGPVEPLKPISGKSSKGAGWQKKDAQQRDGALVDVHKKLDQLGAAVKEVLSQMKAAPEVQGGGPVSPISGRSPSAAPAVPSSGPSLKVLSYDEVRGDLCQLVCDALRLQLEASPLMVRTVDSDCDATRTGHSSQDQYSAQRPKPMLQQLVRWDDKPAEMHNKVPSQRSYWSAQRSQWSLDNRIALDTSQSKRGILAHEAYDDPKEDSWDKHMDIISMMLIVGNSIFLGIEAEVRMSASKGDRDSPSWLLYVNGTFAVVFTLELLLKVYKQRSKFFKRDVIWNCFDILLVMSAIVDVIFTFFNASFIRSMRLLRAVRAARILRTIGYVQDLRLMVASIASSFPSLVWACVLLALFLYLCAIVVMLGVEAFIRKSLAEEVSILQAAGLQASGGEPADLEKLIALFGNLGGTIITLFMSISGGLDWGDCLEVLELVHPLYVPFFVVFVGFMSFSIVGVLTAVIIEASSGILQIDKDLVIQKTLKEELAKKNQLKALFGEIDSNNTGTITGDELSKALLSPETTALLKSMGLGVSHTQNIMRLLDKNGDGSVDIGEFVEGIMHHRGVMATVIEGDQRITEQLDELKSLFEQRQNGSGTRHASSPKAKSPEPPGKE